MIAKRLVALAAAAALVVAAFVVRGARDDDRASSDDPVATVAGRTEAATTGELVCITELADVCDALAEQLGDVSVGVEPAGVTLDRLATVQDAADAPLWLTVEPYPAMLATLRQGRTPLGYELTVLAASRLAIAVPGEERATVLATACGTAELWHCVGASAGAAWSDLDGQEAWGTLRPSLGDVPDSALGLASFAHAVAGYLGTADFDGTTWRADSAFIPWARRLARASNRTPNSGGTPLLTMATRGSALDLAATASYEVSTLGATAEQFAVAYSRPDMWLQVVLAVPGGAGAPANLTDAAGEQLAGASWDEPSAATGQLPSANALLELRALWEDAS